MKIKNKPSVLLDTHIWLRYSNADETLKKSALFALENEQRESFKIFISIYSVWEIAMLESKGRIKLPTGCYQWVEKALKPPAISLVQVTPEILIDSTRLPGDFHGDPADRIIVATAIRLRVPLATQDKQILAYAKTNHIETIS